MAAASDIFEILIFEGEHGMVTPLFFRCCSPLDCVRWVEALQPKNISKGEFPEWDCPQVRVVKPYTAQNSDELTLKVGDLVKIVKQGDDGAGDNWVKGIIELSKFF